MATWWLFSCGPTDSNLQQQSTGVDYQSMPKIDIHAHYQHARDYLDSLFVDWNMRAVLVDVSKQDSVYRQHSWDDNLGMQVTEIDSVHTARSWDQYVKHQDKYPQLFWLCSSFIGVGIDEPDYAQRVIEQLTLEIEAGAKMVKVWKNFGMVTLDQSGRFIQIDNQRLQPIWDFLVSRDIPVMAHIGEPIQAWLPLDDPNNPHYGYYNNHPEYHAYQHPEIPHYDTIMAARDRWMAQNPQLQVLCAHLGSMSHDVQMVAQRLDTYPNMLVEMGARFGDLAGQDSDEVAAFFVKYQDRILFGSDYGNRQLHDRLSAQELEQEQQVLIENYQRLFRYLATRDSLVIRNQHTRGLGLDKEVLEKVFSKNAETLLQL